MEIDMEAVRTRVEEAVAFLDEAEEWCEQKDVMTELVVIMHATALLNDVLEPVQQRLDMALAKMRSYCTDDAYQVEGGCIANATLDLSHVQDGRLNSCVTAEFMDGYKRGLVQERSPREIAAANSPAGDIGYQLARKTLENNR